MPRTQPASRGSSLSSQTHRPGWESDRERGRGARAMSRVTCPLERAGLRVVGLTDGPRWPGERAGPALARNRPASLVTFLPFLHNEMELGESRQAAADRRSFSYPSSSATLGQILILPAVLQLLPNGGFSLLLNGLGLRAGTVRPACVIVSWGFPSKVPQTAWLKTMAVYSLVPLEAQSLKSGFLVGPHGL